MKQLGQALVQRPPDYALHEQLTFSEDNAAQLASSRKAEMQAGHLPRQSEPVKRRNGCL
jgi:hypothetical protein